MWEWITQLLSFEVVQIFKTREYYHVQNKKLEWKEKGERKKGERKRKKSLENQASDVFSKNKMASDLEALTRI